MVNNETFWEYNGLFLPRIESNKDAPPYKHFPGEMKIEASLVAYVVDFICKELRFNKNHLPPPETRELPGGYIISSRYVDEIESLHLITIMNPTDVKDTERRDSYKRSLSLSMTTKALFDRILLNRSKKLHNAIIRKRIYTRVNFECACTSIKKVFQSKINQRQAKLNKFRDTRQKIEELFLPKMVQRITYHINRYIIASKLPALIQQRINKWNQE